MSGNFKAPELVKISTSWSYPPQLALNMHVLLCDTFKKEAMWFFIHFLLLFCTPRWVQCSLASLSIVFFLTCMIVVVLFFKEPQKPVFLYFLWSVLLQGAVLCLNLVLWHCFAFPSSLLLRHFFIFIVLLAWFALLKTIFGLKKNFIFTFPLERRLMVKSLVMASFTDVESSTTTNKKKTTKRRCIGMKKNRKKKQIKNLLRNESVGFLFRQKNATGIS